MISSIAGPSSRRSMSSRPCWKRCALVIGRSFKLSSMHARTLRSHSLAQELHTDVRRDSTDWPLTGFILMIDEFRFENGATRFVPGSHHWPGTPEDVMADTRADHDGQLVASDRRAPCLSSTDPCGMAISPTRRTRLAARSRVRSSRKTGAPGPTSRRECDPRRSRVLTRSRDACSGSDNSFTYLIHMDGICPTGRGMKIRSGIGT